PAYFATLGIPLLQGREFRASDRQGAPSVAIVNEEFVRRYLGGTSPIGSVLRFIEETTPVAFEIVGVVANSKHNTIGEEQRAAFYLPLLQYPERLELAFVLGRTRGDAASLVTAVRRAIGELDRSMAVEVEPMRAKLAFALLPSRIGAAVLGSLGALGLVLAMFGLYAIMSYSVSRRVAEIAIRGALGATHGRIIRLVMRDASALVGIGVMLGLGLAAFVTRPLARFLVAGLSTTDPLSFVGTAAAFALVSVLASWLPARRAARIDPAMAMRLD
ncbi:MAG: FtsX-like permease family protein, partial [Gemmatimonadaceae bacterium]